MKTLMAHVWKMSCERVLFWCPHQIHMGPEHKVLSHQHPMQVNPSHGRIKVQSFSCPASHDQSFCILFLVFSGGKQIVDFWGGIKVQFSVSHIFFLFLCLIIYRFGFLMIGCLIMHTSPISRFARLISNYLINK